MASLRGEQGCSWDKRQTEKAFRTFLLEEVYEVIDAVEKEDHEGLKEELGDVLFHILFIAQICKEKNLFDIRDVLRAAHTKMYNRHPHVFQRGCEPDASQEITIQQRWEEIKRAEKEDYSAVSGVPKILPALLRSYVISKRAAKLGFDWETKEGVHEKIIEEIAEIREAEKEGNKDLVEEEIGDLLFSIVNLARFHDIDPEAALRLTNSKFVRRFAYVESKADLTNPNPKAMDELWNEIKNAEKRGR
ncbi:MAG TPA: nucleoside triphosphate pyrophosphohydrolase [Syntrophorhabdales bacterium]|nr:nucleoside triphosphate pyrophosphohydrolase [Syntrophorhabdales bacterium]